MNKIKKIILAGVIMVIVGVLALPFFLTYHETEDNIQFKVPSEWDSYDDGEFTRVDENTGVIDVMCIYDDYVDAYLEYLRLGKDCPENIGDFKTKDEGEKFFDEYGKDVILDYYDAYYDYDKYSDIHSRDFCELEYMGVVSGKEGEYLKVIETEDDSDVITYVYLHHAHDNLYYMFNIDIYTDEESGKDSDEYSSLMIFEKDILGSFEDTGYEKILDEEIADLSLRDRLPELDLNIFGKTYNLYNVGAVGILIMAVLLFFIVPAIKDVTGDRKSDGSEIEVVDGLSQPVSSSSYEESLKTMVKSGLITKKEYRELMNRHGR